MKYTDARFRSGTPERHPGYVEQVTRDQQDWPGPYGGSFLPELAEQDEITILARIDADRAIESRDMALEAIRENRYEHRVLGPQERHDHFLLQQRVWAAEPVIDNFERQRAKQAQMEAYADMHRLHAEGMSMKALEAEFGPREDWGLAVSEAIGRKITKIRRNRLDALRPRSEPARGYQVAPPPDEIPRSGRS